MNLLLLADPDEARIRSYLPQCHALVLHDGGELVGALLLSRKDDTTFEIMNVAVEPLRSRRGFGSKLVTHAIGMAKAAGAQRVFVGTGNSSFGPLSFYQSLGFRITGVVKGYFEAYVPPIVENGVLSRDLVRLELSL
jgi:ribosomal protein S18 acetylase RimI-like enzyme